MGSRSWPVRRALATGLAVALLAAVMAGCAGLERLRPEAPYVTLAGLRMLDLSLFEQRFEVALRMRNPNGFALPIQGLRYQLEVNGASFAKGASGEGVNLPAYGEEVLRLTVVSDLGSTLAQIRRWQQDPPDDLSYRLTGSVDVGSLAPSLPFDVAGNVALTTAGP